jgi:flagellar hook assembly protein FlgD
MKGKAKNMAKGKWQMATFGRHPGESRGPASFKVTGFRLKTAGMTKVRLCLLTFALCHLPCRPVQAQTISGVTFSATNITYETGGIPNGTTVSFTIDSAGLMQIAVNCGIQNFGDTGTNVANLSQTYAGPGTTTNQIFWNGLWLIGGTLGRNATNCDFTLTLSSNGTSVSSTPSTLVTLNSVDIHGLSVTPTVNSNGAAAPPYAITYALAKYSTVTMTVSNSSGTVVRTLLSAAPEASEIVSTQTLSWNGLTDGGQPAPLGAYTLTVTATDPAIPGSSAIPRTAPIVVQALAGSAVDPQKLFESNVYVYPNPVRNGQGTFQMEAIRDGTNLSLKIYTITGTLVFEQSFPGVPTGTFVTFPWSVTNQSGNKLGRGLYYYVVRENDSTGTLQTVKKMAVLP